MLRLKRALEDCPGKTRFGFPCFFKFFRIAEKICAVLEEKLASSKQKKIKLEEKLQHLEDKVEERDKLTERLRDRIDELVEEREQLKTEVKFWKNKVEKCSHPTDPWVSIVLEYEMKTLPPLENLADFLRAIPQNMKIPLAPWVYSRLEASGLPVAEYFKLFSCGEPDHYCVKLSHQIYRFLDLEASWKQATESSLIPLWDTWLFELVLLSLTPGCSAATNRNSSQGTSTGKKRPDNAMYVDNSLVFLGEEKKWVKLGGRMTQKAKCVSGRSGTSSGSRRMNPQQELVSKLVWMFEDKVDYIFAYAAEGPDVVLLALHQPHGDKHVGKTTGLPLAHFKLNSMTCLASLVTCLFNIARLIPLLGQRLRDVESDHAQFSRRTKTIRIDGFKPVEKVYKSLEDFQNVKNIYSATGLQETFSLEKGGLLHAWQHKKIINEGVNIERLVGTVGDLGALFYPRLSFKALPRNEHELVTALRDVIRALKHLHSRGWIHMDVRWPNVCKDFENGSWWLIDLDEAVYESETVTKPPPAFAEPQQPETDASGGATRHLAEDTHAPELFSGGKCTTAVDLWSLGYLLYDWHVRTGDLKSPALEKLNHDLSKVNPEERPSLEEADSILAGLRL